MGYSTKIPNFPRPLPKFDKTRLYKKHFAKIKQFAKAQAEELAKLGIKSKPFSDDKSDIGEVRYEIVPQRDRYPTYSEHLKTEDYYVPKNIYGETFDDIVGPYQAAHKDKFQHALKDITALADEKQRAQFFEEKRRSHRPIQHPVKVERQAFKDLPAKDHFAAVKPPKTKQSPPTDNSMPWFMLFGSALIISLCLFAFHSGIPLLLAAPICQFALRAHIKTEASPNPDAPIKPPYAAMLLAVLMVVGAAVTFILSGGASLMMLGHLSIEFLDLGAQTITLLILGSIGCWAGYTLGGDAPSSSSSQLVTGIALFFGLAAGVYVGIISGFIPAMVAASVVMAIVSGIGSVIKCLGSKEDPNDKRILDKEAEQVEDQLDEQAIIQTDMFAAKAQPVCGETPVVKSACEKNTMLSPTIPSHAPMSAQ